MILDTYILDITIEQGCDAILSMTFEEPTLDMSGYSFAAKIFNINTGLVVATFSSSFTSGVKTLVLSLTDTITSALTLGDNYDWDVVMIDSSGNKQRIIKGACSIVSVRSE